MKNEHATCLANDIKQKRLLGGNPTQKAKKKKNRFAFFFPYLLFFAFYFIFVILLYSFSFISTLRTMLCLKCWGIERILVFFVA
jgi:uncharacterized membrane protein (DUF485 family)